MHDKINKTPEAIEVRNLATGETMTFIGLESLAALKNAYLYSTGDRNTWDWPQLNPLILVGQSTASCGDWCVYL